MEPEWLRNRRNDFSKKFEELPMPTPKDEEWRYTNLKIDFENLKLEKNIDMEILNKGTIAKELTKAVSDEKVREFFGKTEINDADKIVDFTESVWSNGFFVEAEKDSEVAIKFFPQSNQATRSLIIVHPNVKIKIFEYLENSAADFFSNNTEIIAMENSQVDYFILQKLSKENNFVFKRALCQRNAQVNWHFGYFGGDVSRLKIETVFAGEGSSSENYGVFSGKAEQKFDITTVAHHKVPHTTNNILTKGVLKDKAHSVYRGLIKIEKEAQKTDSYLGDHTLLLGEKALANSIPSLKIDANDVRATHGATVGQVDKDQLFYLMTKGLDEIEAEKLLVEGFLESVVTKFNDENFKKLVKKNIEEMIMNEN